MIGKNSPPGELSKRGWLALMAHSFFYFNFITLEHPISSAVLPFNSFSITLSPLTWCQHGGSDPLRCFERFESYLCAFLTVLALVLWWLALFLCEEECKSPLLRNDSAKTIVNHWVIISNNIRQLAECTHLQRQGQFARFVVPGLTTMSNPLQKCKGFLFSGFSHPSSKSYMCHVTQFKQWFKTINENYNNYDQNRK